MRRQPEKYFFTNTEDCSNCGDRIEVDGPDLTDLLAEKLAAQGICKDCLAVDNLVTCELTVPGTTMVSRVTLCTDCIASVDEAAYVQRCS